MAPVRFRSVLAVLVLALAAFAASPAHALRVVTWNLFAYPSYNLPARQAHFRTVMANLNADVLVVQELVSSAGVDSFQNNVLNLVEPGQWSNSGFFSLQTIPALEGGAIFYKHAKVGVSFTSITPTSGPRDVLFARVTPVGYTNINGTFRVYSVHFKAGGPSTTDSTDRRLEATDLRNTLNAIPTPNINFLVGGDTNIYGAYEGAYLRLTESQADNDGRCFDPLNLPGSWHNNPSYSVHLTQCPCLTSCGSFSGGGLDDRFDLWLSSNAMTNGQGVDVVPGGYSAYGNDGQHYNDDLNGGGFNNAVGLAIATAIKNASDHMPVIVTVQVASKISAASTLPFGSVIVGGTAQQDLSITNSAVAPADALDYSFTMPSGFTTILGNYSLAAGANAPHQVTMNTSTVGVKSGTITINTDAPDSLTKSVSATGTVLAHAVASLDSSAAVVEDTLDFGTQPQGGSLNESVRVHNFGYQSLQAQLEVTGQTITGGDGRFTVVGGSSQWTLGGVGRNVEILFDTNGATTDSTYEATLTITSTDEALPGATAQPDLVVHLKARVTGNTAVIPGPLPTTLAFLAPRPNPVGASTRFAFDLPVSADVALDVFDLGGRRLATLADGPQAAGRHEISWAARDDRGQRLPAGLYFARFQSGKFVRTQRLAILP